MLAIPRISAWNSILPAAFALALTACGNDTPSEDPEPQTKTVTKPAPAGPPSPKQEALEGGPYPALLLSQAWFYKDTSGASLPGPALLEIWRQTPSGWVSSRLEDGDSNVFHKALLRDGSIYTASGEKAMLKKWTFSDGAWTSETLWEKSWGGKFNRLREIEFGDVDGDGADEIVIATHDFGVVAVYNPGPDGSKGEVIELDQKKDTFVHEIEICDIDGDGKLEFFATPSGRNQANSSQHGEVVMYRYDGTTYQRSVVDPGEGTHAKEILCTDIDGDGKDQFFSVQEAKAKGSVIIKPVEVREYSQQADGSFTHYTVATIDDRQTRFLVPGDFDQDGQQELVAAAMKKGLFLIDGSDSKPGEQWKITSFQTKSSGFEHATLSADIDKDGTLELYVAADDQSELRKYTYNAEKKTFDNQLLGRLQPRVFTWNIEAGSL